MSPSSAGSARAVAVAAVAAFASVAAFAAFALAAVALAGCGAPPGDSAPPRDAAIDAPAADAGPPDLVINPSRSRVDLAVEERFFDVDACELHPDEACIDGPGDRRLLRFSIETPNIGLGDLYLGPPGLDNPLFSWSECHGHYHYQGYAEYTLLDGDGDPVKDGRKQAFCLVDTRRFAEDDPTVAERGRYNCDDQGIQRGWSDIYQATLPCQFIDITGVPDGAYTLRLRLNVEQTLPELDHDNNTVELAVAIGGPDIARPDEPCPPEDRAHAEHTGRECGWHHAGTWPCTPGTSLSIGCAQGCELGSCTGDPMLRLCDAARPDGNCSHAAVLGQSDNACGSSCPRIPQVLCPASGTLDVYTAPRIPGDPYTCDLAVSTFP